MEAEGYNMPDKDPPNLKNIWNSVKSFFGFGNNDNKKSVTISTGTPEITNEDGTPFNIALTLDDKNIIASYPGESINNLMTDGVQYIASELSGQDVSRETAENIQLVADVSSMFFTKGKNPEAGKNIVTRTKDVLGHIFTKKNGHVKPITEASEERFIKLFENVANDSKNLNPNILSEGKKAAGVTGHSKTFKNGQVWTHSKDGKIFDAGVNRKSK
ncbi:hypothetical protein HX001_06730 [Empedobacter brevis]|uniref:Uncharacterized protein n=1 Tax=Empedobacter brevis TaxID=247 RepID=A0AAJ1QDT3_9FLAO|nr:hypothetical protein [Empedobacter brevis]MDM1072190.1 hypothetical protein [Empedobacter brevis]